MNAPLINILIRMQESRKVSFLKALKSIQNQTYKNVRVIVSYDYLKENLTENEILVKADKSLGKFFYNDYCNALKNEVKEGWFMFLDSDDYLANDKVLEDISKHFDEEMDYAIVCQMSRNNGKVKPSNELIENKIIVSGKIGLPCVIVNSALKDAFEIGVSENADYNYIKQIYELGYTKFVPQVVVHSPKRNFGL